MKSDLGIIFNLQPEFKARWTENFNLYELDNLEDEAIFYHEIAPNLQYLSTYSAIKTTNDLLDKFPKLEFISNVGVGLDNVDVEYIKKRGIALTHTPGVLDDCVADMAIGLLIAVSRKIVFGDRYVRQGNWTSIIPNYTGTKVSGKKIGILGLGKIGKQIALRAKGFRMEIAYHGRKEQPDQPYRYFSKLNEMASWADFFVVAVPATSYTNNIVDREILHNIGSTGVLINIARGSVIDEPAMIEALVQSKLGGAGLDVFANEPDVPKQLRTLDNVVLQPHRGGLTTESYSDMLDLGLANLTAYIKGQSVLTPAY